jgi:hypothetical protein
MHGDGRLTWKDGTVYTGQFQRNSARGRGVYEFADGGRYEGDGADLGARVAFVRLMRRGLPQSPPG